MKRINKNLLLTFTLLFFIVPSKADEGMWIPLLLEKYNIEDMQTQGCKLSADDIYSINRDCLTDAVVIFGSGCTGEVISDQGLVITNHHCGFGAIQSHSSVEHDYLTDGYWAMNREEELPNLNLSVKFLRFIEDVTDEILDGTENVPDEEQWNRIIERNIALVSGTATEDGGSRAVIKSFYYGNEYYMFVYDVFSDVRLVGAPPNSIGNFGEDNDNWMWPRHTGDFSLFRIYADTANQPADYSPDNVPYTPRKHLELSLKGIEEGDFTMALGYPGSTTQYLYSAAVRSMVETTLPHDINLRTLRLDIIDSYMKESHKVQIQYATKYRRISNSWKKWKGMIRGLKRMNAVERKKEMEEKFIDWMNADDLRIMKYDRLMPEFQQTYDDLDRYLVVMEYMDEAVSAVELLKEITSLKRMMSQGISVEIIAFEMEAFYKDYHHPIDREIFETMMKEFYNEIDSEFHPDFFAIIKGKYKGDFKRFAEKTYAKTIFSSPGKVKKLLEVYESDQAKAMKLLSKDPLLIYMDEFREMYMVKVYPEHNQLEQKLEKLYKNYVTALREMETDKTYYPDANFTMRLTYGKIEGYQSVDAVLFDYYTTLSGIIEKSREGQQDYVIPEKLEALYRSKDFGEYGFDGVMPVCFTASNHTTGGNSGSPVLNADGRLIGINFDRNWEGTMSDVMYDPDQCRNISVDIRYVLFVIDKFAGAGYLLDEMDIVR